MKREPQLRLWPRIHDHGVADVCEDDRVAGGAAGSEALEDPADVVAIGAHRRPMIVVVPGVVLLVIVVVARQGAPKTRSSKTCGSIM